MIAAYQRISRADGDLGKDGKDKSNSIENQKELIQRYIACKESLQNVPVMDFVDDGYTGSNFDRPGLKELAKGDDRILFTGFVQGAMLDELYSNAYIYTLPSDLEGMPLSLLEAMSYGNCCLVSDIPECAEVVEDKAWIFLSCVHD